MDKEIIEKLLQLTPEELKAFLEAVQKEFKKDS